MGENEGRLGCLDREVEQILAIAGDDVGVVEDDHDAQRAGFPAQRQNARIGNVELLRMRVQLDRGDALARKASQFVDRRMPVVRVDRRDRNEPGMRLGGSASGASIRSFIVVAPLITKPGLFPTSHGYSAFSRMSKYRPS